MYLLNPFTGLILLAILCVGCKSNELRMDVLDRLIASGQISSVHLSDAPEGTLKVDMQDGKAYWVSQ